MSRTNSIIAVVALVAVSASARNWPTAQNNAAQTQQVAVIQPGTAIAVRLTDRITTSNIHAGDTFSAVVAADVLANNVVVIRQGSAVTLRAAEVVPGSHTSRPAKLTLEAVSVALPTGARRAIVTSPVSTMGQVISHPTPPAAQVIYSVPVAGAWRTIAGALASTVAVTRAVTAPDVVLQPGQLLRFVLNAPLAVQ